MMSATVEVQVRVAAVGSGLSTVSECCFSILTAVARLIRPRADGFTDRNVNS